MPRRDAVIGMGLLLVIGQAACGSHGASGSCGMVQPCGGAVVGTWKVSDECQPGASSATSSSCGVTITSRLTLSGTFTFNADLTYAESLLQSGAFTVSVPATCLSPRSAIATCADVQAFYQGTVQSHPDRYRSVSCAGAGAGCECQIEVVPQSATSSGTYATGTMAGGPGTLRLTDSSGSSVGGDYCVSGNELHLLGDTPSGDGGTGGPVTITSDLVARKQ